MNTECSITEHMLEVFCVSYRFISYFVTESWHNAFDMSRFCFAMIRNLKKIRAFLFHSSGTQGLKLDNSKSKEASLI